MEWTFLNIDDIILIFLLLEDEKWQMCHLDFGLGEQGHAGGFCNTWNRHARPQMPQNP